MISKILLVDDDYASNLYHKIIIEDANIAETLDVCTSVDESLDYLKTTDSPPSIIFIDINMPLKDAWDFLKGYGELEQSKHAKKLVILSTTKNPVDVSKAESNQFVDYFFTKPLTLEIIAQCHKES